MIAKLFNSFSVWYRATVRKLTADRKARVFFDDFGNEDVLDFDDMRELWPAFKTAVTPRGCLII